MKSIQGIVVAIALGITGAVFNWMYLHSGPSREATVTFVGIKQGQIISRGDVLRDDYLVPLTLPETWVGNLRNFAVEYRDKSTVIGQPISRALVGECLLLTDDLKTPPEELKLEPGETAMWIPVDSRAFVPSLFKPGDTVSFLVPRGAMPAQPAQPGGAPPSPLDAIGPFTILALGNRLGSLDVMRAAKMQPVQENVLAIRVSPHVAGETDRAEKLYALLQSSNFRQVGIQLHAKNKDKQ
jgi:hypothetical protein